MGVFSQALDVAEGLKKAERLKALRAQFDTLKQMVADLAQDYDAFRVELGEDAEDIAAADQSLTAAIADAKSYLDALPSGAKAIYVTVIEGLGFEAVE